MFKRQADTSRVDSFRSWVVANAALFVVTIAFGAPYITVVALTQIADDIGGGARSVPALAFSLSSIGAGAGGLFFGWWAERVGILKPFILGTIFLIVGTALSGYGTKSSLYLGFGLLGLLGIGALYAPLVAYVSKWFERRRGLALSWIASGQQVAGALWPPIFERLINLFGWKTSLYYFAIFTGLVLPPLFLLLRGEAPEASPRTMATVQSGASETSASYNAAFTIMCIAIVCCCIAMAMPMGHLVAFCGDRGYSLADGTTMLAVLLGCAFLSRLLWGWLSDLIGGLATVWTSAACQAASLALFLPTYDLTKLYFVSIAFGLGFGGIIPAYILAVREICPANEAGWRIATLLFFSMLGMAIGGWLAGYIFDITLDYQIAFGVGVAFNLITLILIGILIGWRWYKDLKLA